MASETAQEELISTLEPPNEATIFTQTVAYDNDSDQASKLLAIPKFVENSSISRATTPVRAEFNIQNEPEITDTTASSKHRTISGDEIAEFQEKYQLNVSLIRLNDITVVYNLTRYTTYFHDNINGAIQSFKACCIARHKHKTLEAIGLLICDIDQLFNILEYFGQITHDHEDILYDQVVGLRDESGKVYKLVSKMLKYSIMPPLKQDFVKTDIAAVADSMESVVLDLFSYIIQRLLTFVSISGNLHLLNSLAKVLSNACSSRKKKFSITSKLEQWLREKAQCSSCFKDISLQPCIYDTVSCKKWHIGCSRCAKCGKRYLGKDLLDCTVEVNNIVCGDCKDINAKKASLVLFSTRQQTISLLKIGILEVVQELEGDNYGYICQEWVKYWRMDSDDLAKLDRKTQKVQSAIFELIHRQQFFVDTASDFLKFGDKFLIEAQNRPDELDPNYYDIIFKPVKELRKIHKKFLLSPMLRLLADQGMVVRNTIFKLYLHWINKSHVAYEDYLMRLADSKLLQDLDKMRDVPFLQNWITAQKSTELEKSLSGGFYYQMIQTKDIMKGLEKVLDKNVNENTIVYQISKLVDRYSFQLHAVLDRGVTKAYISRIQNLEVKRADVHYKKHVFVKYKNKSTNEMVNCCLIMLNMCLVITKLSIETGTFIKFAPLIYTENLEYERIDNKLLISDRTRKELDVFKFHFRNEEEARLWCL